MAVEPVAEPVDLAALVEDPTRVATVAPGRIPALLSQLSALQSAMAARLISADRDEPVASEDTLLTVDQAAERLGVSTDWLFRRSRTLPFVVRLGRHLRFSNRGINRYLRNRTGRSDAASQEGGAMSNTTRSPSKRKKVPGMGRIFQRGQTFWIAYYRHGKEHRESTHSVNENDATKLLKKRYGEIASRRFVGPQEERVMFEDLAKGIERDYKLRGLRSTRAAKGRMLHLKKQFGGMRALDITPDRVRDYQAQRRKEKASPATVYRETSHLARAFRIAVKSGLLTVVPPFPNHLEESAPRQGFFEHAEYLAVRQHLTPPVYQDVLDFAYYSGWRRGEITGLTWREIDMAGGVIRLDPDRSKTKTGRLLPMSQPLKEVLQRRVAARRLDCLMVFHRDGEEMIDWRKAWAAACKLAGLPGKRLHDCRRTGARNLIRSGTPERVAMQLTGHKTRSVFDRYNIVSESDLRAGVDRLAAYVKRLPKETIVEPLKKAGKARG